MRRALTSSRGLVAVVAVVVILFVCCRPPSSATAAPPASTVRGAYHIHSNRSDGSGTSDEIAAAAARAGLQFVILTDHGDGTRAPDPPAYRSGVLMHRRRRAQHHRRALRGARPAGDAVPARRDARRRDRRRARLGGFGIAAHPGSPRPSLRWTTGTRRSTASSGSTPTANGATSRACRSRARC